MRFAAWLVLGTGCNAVFGLDKTAALPPIDAQYFDAPIDAPFACPPPGEQPQFTHVVRQIEQECAFYTSSVRVGRAVTICRIPLTGALTVHEGPLEGPFEPRPEFVPDAPGVVYDKPRLAPEGDLLFVRKYNSNQFTGFEIKAYRRTDSTWTFDHNITGITLDAGDNLTEPTLGPRRQMGVFRGSGVLEIFDVSASGAATLVKTHPPGSLFPSSVYPDVHLHADGLRVIFNATTTGRTRTFISERASLDAVFGLGVELADVPVSVDVHMTENCDRLVFPGLGWLVWLKRA